MPSLVWCKVRVTSFTPARTTACLVSFQTYHVSCSLGNTDGGMFIAVHRSRDGVSLFASSSSTADGDITFQTDSRGIDNVAVYRLLDRGRSQIGCMAERRVLNY